jgi:hypothetical protein
MRLSWEMSAMLDDSGGDEVVPNLEDLSCCSNKNFSQNSS